MYGLFSGGRSDSSIAVSGKHVNGSVSAAQIDMLIDRADGVIDLCEMKYTVGEYSISQKEETEILNRKARFMEETKTLKAIHTVLITTIGLAQNEHSDIIDNIVIINDLFKY